MEKTPRIEYFFSSSDGDIALQEQDFSRQFMVSMEESLASITFGDYLKAVGRFISHNAFSRIRSLLTEERKKHELITAITIEKVKIRSEKHGAFYHIASAEVFNSEGPLLKLAVVSACTENTRLLLHNEFYLLKDLEENRGTKKLPAQYFLDCHVVISKRPEVVFSISLSEWFEDFFEWHFSFDSVSGIDRVVVWDTRKGNFFINDFQARELFRKIAYILTMHYDFESGHQIYMWHHAAGDFIVRCDNNNVDVKLITVRKYGNYLKFIELPNENAAESLIYFFLDLTVRMRADRRDGVGEPIVAGKMFLESVLEGFFDAIKERNDKNPGCSPFEPSDFIKFMAALEPSELSLLFTPLFNLYEEEGDVNMPFLRSGFSEHIRELHEVLSGWGTSI